MADDVIWSEQVDLMWSSAMALPAGRAEATVAVVATEDAVTIDLTDLSPGDQSTHRVAIPMCDIAAIEVEGRSPARSPLEWELFTGFPVERADSATTGMLIRCYQREVWVLRLRGAVTAVVPRIAGLLARKERLDTD
jgi:hypothetical protein